MPNFTRARCLQGTRDIQMVVLALSSGLLLYSSADQSMVSTSTFVDEKD